MSHGLFNDHLLSEVAPFLPKNPQAFKNLKICQRPLPEFHPGICGRVKFPTAILKTANHLRMGQPHGFPKFPEALPQHVFQPPALVDIPPMHKAP